MVTLAVAFELIPEIRLAYFRNHRIEIYHWYISGKNPQFETLYLPAEQQIYDYSMYVMG
jgi:hypothetical protein